MANQQDCIWKKENPPLDSSGLSAGNRTNNEGWAGVGAYLGPGALIRRQTGQLSSDSPVPDRGNAPPESSGPSAGGQTKGGEKAERGSGIRTRQTSEQSGENPTLYGSIDSGGKTVNMRPRGSDANIHARDIDSKNRIGDNAPDAQA